MRRTAPESLKGQLDTMVAAASAAADWFRRPAPSALSAARTARLRALGWREAAVSAKPLRGFADIDAADLSFALREAVEHLVSAVAEAARYGVEPDAGLLKTAEALRSSAKSLSAAASARGAKRVAAIIDAKRWAGEAERLRRLTRSDAHENPSLTDALKREAVSNRFSNAAEAVQQACDALSGGLAE